MYTEKLSFSMVSIVQGEEKLKLLEKDHQKEEEEATAIEAYIEALRSFAQDISKNKEGKKQALEARRGNELEIRIKNVEKNVFEEFHGSNPKQKRKMREKWIEAEPSLGNRIVRLDPYLAIESNFLWDTKARQFSTFLESIKTIQQNYEGSEQALLNALESRFNLRKDEADLEKKLDSTNTYIT